MKTGVWKEEREKNSFGRVFFHLHKQTGYKNNGDTTDDGRNNKTNYYTKLFDIEY